MRITVPMYEKGRSFVMASGLVKAYEGHKFVYLHLLCQGFECIGKALLLAHNYEQYEPILRRNFNHDLEKLVKEVLENSAEILFSDDAIQELINLNSYYQRHILRYGDASDFEEEAALISADHLYCELVGYLIDLNDKFLSLNDGV